MPVVARVDPKTVFSADEWRRLTSRSSLRGMWLVAHAWGTIAAAIALVTLWPNPLTWLVAVTVVGTRQLGLAILMHEAAHGGLHNNKTINEWVGQWLCAVPVAPISPATAPIICSTTNLPSSLRTPICRCRRRFRSARKASPARRSAISPARHL